MAKDPLIEVKPSYAGVTLNLNELWRRFRRKPRKPTVEDVAQRFLQLFNEHGIETTQIPRWAPTLSLAELNKTTKLLAALTPQVLEQAAKIFGVERTWLEGAAQGIYHPHACYKNPEALFALLAQLRLERHSFPIRALTCVKALDYRDASEQSLALVVAEKIADAEGVENIWDIDRYHVFADAWNWGYAPCRIQLKGMVRVIDQIIGAPVPLYTATAAELEANKAGRLIPRRFFLRSPLTSPSLEDYALAKPESAQAKELEELPYVMDYIEANGLEQMARNVRKS